MKILVADDGSEFGAKTINFLADFVSGDAGHQVKIVTVVEPVSGTELESLIEDTSDLLELDGPPTRDASKIVDRARRQLKKRLAGKDIDISTEVLVGPAARSIVENAEAWHADLIVLGTHGLGYWKKTWFGSVSERVMYHAHCSVTIVRN